MRRQFRAVCLMAAFLGTSVGAKDADSEVAVLAPVRAFYAAFGEGFVKPADFATQDWTHINPGGGRTSGREAVLAEVRSVHQTFLKDVSDTIVSADVRFADPDVAVVTVLSRTSPFAMPGTSPARPHDQIRTFVVVKRQEGWKILQDQNTEVQPAGNPR